MSLMGSAVVAIWNDITDEGRDNFYQWHDREHIPERIGIEGFLRGRRYIATQGAPEYFTLYEVRDTAVLGSAAYLTRLNNPTRWTTDSVRHFRNTARSLCHTDMSLGIASGATLGTLRFDCDPGQDMALMETVVRILRAVVEDPGIVAAHVCRADVAVSTAKTAEQTGRPPNAVPRWVIMIEGSMAEAVQAALAGPLGNAAFKAFALTDPARGTYVLQFDLLQSSG
jgi:hypothetical protein